MLHFPKMSSLSESETQTGPHKDWITRAHTHTHWDIFYFSCCLPRWCKMDSKMSSQAFTCPNKTSASDKLFLHPAAWSAPTETAPSFGALCVPGFSMSTLELLCSCTSWVPKSKPGPPLPYRNQDLSVWLTVFTVPPKLYIFFYLFSFPIFVCWPKKSSCLLKQLSEHKLWLHL